MSEKPSMRVMVAIDQSDIAQYAFHYYLDTLHRPGNEVVFAHSAEPPYVGTGLGVAGYGFASGAQYDQMIRERREEVRRLKQHYVNLLHARKDVHYRFNAVEFGGNPGEALVRIAKDEESQLIVMGSRGLGKIRRTVMGSVSNYVVHHAHCPVMIAHNPHQKSD